LPSTKGAILKAIAAFALTPKFASDIWTQLEISQILPTRPRDPNLPVQLEGIKYELEEVEKKAETFPELKGFLTLILRLLLSTGVPESLGAGSRTPGFHPYLHFLVDQCFLPIADRKYKNPEEEGELAALCLRTFYHLLLLLQVGQVSMSPGELTAAQKHPGFELLLRVLCGSRFLITVTHTLSLFKSSAWSSCYLL